ncbi:SCO family protein [Thermocrinis minervae]|uniref:Protein SCO1/2 n=1 Tax=Thermocrinis minervae TaxID=381751 RepID=A0A1M6RB52_9AQUI|nr:SCO family protein [Thermocrinis minervae]SHK29699.1 protein SCO1/2 [Thermocrinis minervae]
MKFLLGLLPLFFFITFSFSQNSGTGIPPDESKTLGKPLPNVSLIDSEGKVFELYSLKGKPLIISPIYTNCSSACPIITKSLKEVLPSVGTVGKDFNVISFSFDYTDTVKDLRKFKEREGLPKEWIVATGKTRQDLFELVDAIDFRFMSIPETKDFVHPNFIVFVSPDMRIKKYLYGVTFKVQDIKDSLYYAVGHESLSEKLRPYIFFLSLVGFSISLLYIILKLTRKV